MRSRTKYAAWSTEVRNGMKVRGRVDWVVDSRKSSIPRRGIGISKGSTCADWR